jgi:hypothetical protein
MTWPIALLLLALVVVAYSAVVRVRSGQRRRLRNMRGSALW